MAQKVVRFQGVAVWAAARVDWLAGELGGVGGELGELLVRWTGDLLGDHKKREALKKQAWAG